MSDPIKSRMDMLERTVLELGAELYNVKGWVARNQESHEQFLSIIKGLKQLLDEKGLITVEDFEAAVELGQALEAFSAQADLSGLEELDKDKKSGH